MGRIEDRLRAWRDDIDEVDGRRLIDPYVEFPEFDLYNKAFRLKHFGKCPLCDAHLKALRSVSEMRQYIECAGCEFNFSIGDSDVIAASDADDPIINVVRRALEKQEAQGR